MKKYNITKTAEKLGVVRQTIYNWIQKGWITPKRDYRGYPVFTDEDIVQIQKWMNKLDEV